MRLFSVTVFAMLMIALPVTARADVQYYPFAISTYDPKTPPVYTGPVSRDAPGTVHEVETDANHRLVRVTYWHSGKKGNELVYQFDGLTPYPKGYKFYQDGKFTSVVEFERNDAGEVIKRKFFNTQGVSTGYEASTYLTDEIDTTRYNAAGVVTSRRSDYFSSSGILARRKNYSTEGTGTYWEYFYDVSTGLTTSERYFEFGRLKGVQEYTRDVNGALVRTDLIDPSTHKPYGHHEYVDGLVRRTVYNFATGETKELLSYYDDNRVVQRITLTENGKLVCTFTFQRAPGTNEVTRSVAIGPNGELMAEYPDAFVSDVWRNGNAVDGSKGTIYKKGDWW